MENHTSNTDSLQTHNHPDPRGEYLRICPYCEEIFTADHMLRVYCPEKNGIEDYCKNRYKRLRMQEKISPIHINTSKKLQEQNSESAPDGFEPLPESSSKPSDILSNNSDILSAAIGKSQGLILSAKYLQFKGLIFSEFNEQHQIPGTKLFIATYGPFALAWVRKNEVFLTYKSLIPWIPTQCS
jgi:hypothetical protein